MTHPDGKGTETPVSFRLDDRLRAQLEEVAKRNDRSLSAEIRRALKAHIKTQLAAEAA